MYVYILLYSTHLLNYNLYSLLNDLAIKTLIKLNIVGNLMWLDVLVLG